jgi:hypothetical protein
MRTLPQQTGLSRITIATRVLFPSLCLLAASTFAADAPRLAGSWAVHQSIAGNESDQECTFTQDNAKVAGSCKIGEQTAKVAGSVDGKKVTWKYDMEYNGSTLTLIYAATLDDADKFSGSVEVQPYGVSGEFSAKRSKETK